MPRSNEGGQCGRFDGPRVAIVDTVPRRSGVIVSYSGSAARGRRAMAMRSYHGVVISGESRRGEM